MFFDFVDYKSDITYETLLAKISFPFCDNPDGRLYTVIKHNEIEPKKIVAKLIDKLTPFIFVRKNVIILNLLVNPFFEELCSYLNEKPNIGNSKVVLLKKYIFSYLSDERTKTMYSDLKIEGAQIYREKNMYEQSKEILQRIKTR